MLIRKTFGILFVLLAVLASVSLQTCGGTDTASSTVSCTTSIDCPVGYSCQDGQCLIDGVAILCTADEECKAQSPFYICAALADGTSKCIPATDPGGDGTGTGGD